MTWGTWRYYIDDLFQKYPPDFVEDVRSQAVYLALRRNRLRIMVRYIKRTKEQQESEGYYPLKKEDVEMFSDPLTIRAAESYLDYMLEHLFSLLDTPDTADFFIINGAETPLRRMWKHIKHGFIKWCIRRGDGSTTLYEVAKALLKFSNRYANDDVNNGNGGMDVAGLLRRASSPEKKIYKFPGLYKKYEAMKRNLDAKNDARINTKYASPGGGRFVQPEPKKCTKCKTLTYNVDSKLKLPFCERRCQEIFYKTNEPSC